MAATEDKERQQGRQRAPLGAFHTAAPAAAAARGCGLARRGTPAHARFAPRGTGAAVRGEPHLDNLAGAGPHRCRQRRRAGAAGFGLAAFRRGAGLSLRSGGQARPSRARAAAQTGARGPAQRGGHALPGLCAGPALGHRRGQSAGRGAVSGLGARRGATPNLLRFLFLCPAARGLIHDWETRAWRLVAEFRADCGRLAESPAIHPLIAELAAGSEAFARLWQTQDVLGREGGERRFQHPQLGPLVFEQLTLRPDQRGDLKLVLLLPAT